MRPTILLAGVLPLVSAFLGGILALQVMAPGVIDAQEARIRAESVIVVDDNGTARVRLTTGPGARSDMTVLSQGGIPPVSLSTGGGVTEGGTQPDEARVWVFAPEGPRGSTPEHFDPIAAIGTGPAGAGSVMYLRDGQGRIRSISGWTGRVTRPSRCGMQPAT